MQTLHAACLGKIHRVWATARRILALQAVNRVQDLTYHTCSFCAVPRTVPVRSHQYLRPVICPVALRVKTVPADCHIAGGWAGEGRWGCYWQGHRAKGNPAQPVPATQRGGSPLRLRRSSLSLKCMSRMHLHACMHVRTHTQAGAALHARGSCSLAFGIQPSVSLVPPSLCLQSAYDAHAAAQGLWRSVCCGCLMLLQCPLDAPIEHELDCMLLLRFWPPGYARHAPWCCSCFATSLVFMLPGG